MARIGIIGSGNVGANTAFFAAEKNIAPVLMHDVKEGLSTGKALDMMEAAPVRGYKYPVAGTDDLADVLDSEVIIIAAGEVRKPGETRQHLFPKNRATVEQLADSLSGYEGVVVVATEPVDSNVGLFVEKSGLPWQRVLGLGCTLDTMRMRFFIAEELGVDAASVNATVIGSHSDRMLPLASYTDVAGVPITALLTGKRWLEIVERTRHAGDTLLEHYQRATSYYGPAAAAVDVAEAVIRDSHRVLPVSFVWSGQYGMSGVAMSLPAILGAGGIERVLEPRLGDEEKSILEASAAAVGAR